VACLPFTVAHVHFHDLRHPRLRWEWLDPPAEDADLGDYSAIKSLRYTADHFAAGTHFYNVDKFVHVQAALGSADPVEGTRWLQTFSDRIGVPNGIVAATDLAAPDAGEVLRRYCESANVRGIRDLRHDDYPENPDWQRGYGLLEQHVRAGAPTTTSGSGAPHFACLPSPRTS
jgi:predicted TIM-barrel fold metal-dependent hydrolase